MLTFDSMKRKKEQEIYKTTKEYDFYDRNKKYIDKVKSSYSIEETDYGFFLICSNILIRAFQTKEMIEDYSENFKNCSKEELDAKMKVLLENRPYINYKNENIYLPQFPKALNFIYLHDPLALEKYPYNTLKTRPSLSSIDLFDEYGFNLFNSNFTSLKLIIRDKSSAAFLSVEFETIYVINDQGRLDMSIPFFDKYMKEKNFDNLEDRVLNVMKLFYENNRIQFIHSLYDENLISKKMFRFLLKKVSIRTVRKAKLTRGKDEEDVF